MQRRQSAAARRRRRRASRVVLRDGIGRHAPARPAPADRDALRALLPRAVARVAAAPVLQPRRAAGRADRSASATRAIPRAALTLLALRLGRRRAAADRRRLLLRHSATATAEAAFAVDDRFQGKGLGTMLLERLAAIAARARLPRASRRRRSPTTRRCSRSSTSRASRSARSPSAARSTVQLSLSPTARVGRRRRAAARARRPPRRCGRCSTPRAVAVDRRVARPGSIGRRVLRRARRAAASPGRSIRSTRTPTSSTACRCYRVGRATRRAASTSPSSPCRAPRGARRRRRLRRGRREVAGRHHRRLRRSRRRRAARCSSSSSRRSAATACGWSAPTAWACSTPTPRVRLNASFSPILPPSGRVALLVAERRARPGDSRARDRARRRPVDVRQRRQQGRRLGQRPAASTGKPTRRRAVILLYLESFGNPRRFARLARRIARTKPIVAVKAGRTRAGSRAAGSHTAALAASDTAVDALFHQSGVIRADTIDEMFDIAACLDAQPLPPDAASRSSPTPADRASSPSTPAKRPA